MSASIWSFLNSIWSFLNWSFLNSIWSFLKRISYARIVEEKNTIHFNKLREILAGFKRAVAAIEKWLIKGIGNFEKGESGDAATPPCLLRDELTASRSVRVVLDRGYRGRSGCRGM